MSASADNLDLNLSLNLPLSRMHMEMQSRSPLAWLGHGRPIPDSTLPPPSNPTNCTLSPPSNPTNSCKLSAAKFVSDCNSDMLAQHSRTPPPKSPLVLPNNVAIVPNELAHVGGKIRGIASVQILKQEKAVNNFSPGLVSNMGARCVNKPKSAKHTKIVVQEAKLEPVNNFNITGCCRYDSSLGLLTKKFIKLIQGAKDGTLDLNRTADILQVQKRRIYDITNVLEGIGLIEKTTKNHIRLKGFGISEPQKLDEEVSHLKTEVESLRAEDCRLDDLIRDKLEDIRELISNQDFQKDLFLTEEDIRSLPSLRNQTIIAIQAPRASFLEVPDPDEDIDFCQKQYKLTVRSSTRQIGVYLLSKEEEKTRDFFAKRAKLLDQSMWTIRSRVDDANISSRPSDTSTSSNASGFQKLVPLEGVINDDYWLKSDHEVSISELWSTEKL